MLVLIPRGTTPTKAACGAFYPASRSCWWRAALFVCWNLSHL